MWQLDWVKPIQCSQTRFCTELFRPEVNAQYIYTYTHIHIYNTVCFALYLVFYFCVKVLILQSNSSLMCSILSKNVYSSIFSLSKPNWRVRTAWLFFLNIFKYHSDINSLTQPEQFRNLHLDILTNKKETMPAHPSTRVLLARRMQCSHSTLDTASGMRTWRETSVSRWLNCSNSWWGWKKRRAEAQIDVALSLTIYNNKHIITIIVACNYIYILLLLLVIYLLMKIVWINRYLKWEENVLIKSTLYDDQHFWSTWKQKRNILLSTSSNNTLSRWSLYGIPPTLENCSGA